MTPCGRTRREFLWQTGCGFTGVALSALLHEDGFAPRRAEGAEGVAPLAIDPLSPKTPHFPAKAKNVIFLFMYGGPSQVDLFDPKPILNQKNGKTIDIEVRKGNVAKATLMGTPRGFSRSGRSGIEISDLYSNLARQVDDMAIIRSMYADSFAHGSAIVQMNTGSVFQGKPCLGSWVGYGLGTSNRDLPSFVVLIDPRGGPINGATNWSSGYMPATYQGTQFRTQGDPILDLSPRGSPRTNSRSGCSRALPRRSISPPNRPKRKSFTASTANDPPISAASACWRGGSSNAASASSRFIREEATTMKTGMRIATSTPIINCIARKPIDRSRVCSPI